MDRLHSKQIVDASPEQLDRILEPYQLIPQGPFIKMSGSRRNETWTVETNAGKKVLKRYQASVPYQQICFEHSILNHLAENNFPAPRLCRDTNGITILEYENRFYAVSDFLEGYFHFNQYFFVPSRNRVFYFLFGQSLGLLHHTLAGFTPDGESDYGFQSPDGDRWQDASWHLARLEYASGRLIHSLDPITRDLESFLNEQSQWIETQFRHLDVALQKVDLSRQLIHGDYGPYNMLVKPGEPLAVIDFEMAHLDWRLIDLVAAVSSTTNQINSKPNISQMRQIVKGYQSVNPVDAEEISLIPFVWQFKMLRRVITCIDNYLADGKIIRLEEARKRIEKLDWIMRYENELRILGQD